MTVSTIEMDDVCLQSGGPLFIIAGLCVLEDEEINLSVAKHLKKTCEMHGLPFIFKASFDKANRSSLKSYRGPGLGEGLRILSRIRQQVGVPVLTDVHTVDQAEIAAETVDILQIPAFLCRQTDLILAAARMGKPVNVKKGQFMAPQEMKNVVDKIRSVENEQILLTERGTTFGYNNLVVDFRSVPTMQSFGAMVVYDGTHSVQCPGGLGDKTGGQPEFIPTLTKAAVAAGVDGIFLETHPSPERALSDGANSLPLERFDQLISCLASLGKARRELEI